jgi:hypothetical protein
MSGIRLVNEIMDGGNKSENDPKINFFARHNQLPYLARVSKQFKVALSLDNNPLIPMPLTCVLLITIQSTFFDAAH